MARDSGVMSSRRRTRHSAKRPPKASTAPSTCTPLTTNPRSSYLRGARGLAS